MHIEFNYLAQWLPKLTAKCKTKSITESRGSQTETEMHIEIEYLAQWLPKLIAKCKTKSIS